MPNEIQKGPNLIHPEKPSAVGSRNSLNRSGRNEYEEANIIVDEEIDKVLNHLHSKLPPEVLEKLDILGGVKPKLHNYFNQSFQNMLSRYLTTTEDELAKKYRDLIDKEEHRNLNTYTSRSITEILDKIGGPDRFNTGEIEKSIVNVYGHLQGHIQRGIFELEHETNGLLRQKNDVGAFVRGENSYAIAKCSFKDNLEKPETVIDVKLALNILDSELVSPIHHYHEPVTKLLKQLISDHIQELIDKEVTHLNQSLLDEGKEELSDNEVIFEKLKALDNHFDEDTDKEESKRYSIVAKKFLDSIDEIGHQIQQQEYDALQIRENVVRILEDENIRNRGFNTIVNNLTSILDTSKMGYQHIENFKNIRKCFVSEYEDKDLNQLPDERFNVTLSYYEQEQLNALKKSYDEQFEEFKSEINKTAEVVEVLYEEYKKNNQVIDFDDVEQEYAKKNHDHNFDIPSSKEEVEEQGKKLWEDIHFVIPEDTEIEILNKTNRDLTTLLKKKIITLKNQLVEIYKNQNPPNRIIVEERIQFLEKQFLNFASQINPYQIQAGLIIEVNITSVKRKKTTMMSMANVLNEFLFSISKGFTDKAFAGFSRRRSTVRTDIDDAFASITTNDDEEYTDTSSVASA